MKTLRNGLKVLDKGKLLLVNGGYSSSSGGSSFSSNSSGRTVSGPSFYTATTSYASRCTAHVKSGYAKNYELLCGWAKALGLM